MLHVWNIYLHLRLNVAIFHLMLVNILYMEHLGKVDEFIHYYMEIMGV